MRCAVFLKRITITVISLISVSGFADSKDLVKGVLQEIDTKKISNIGLAPEAPCTKCEEKAQNLRKPLPIYPNPINGMARSCMNFIRADGTLGPFGQAIVKNIQNKENFYNPKAKGGLTSVCKNWNSLSKSEKEIFWVWAFASIANDESSCNASVVVPGMPGRKAAGLLQIEHQPRNRNFRQSACSRLSAKETLNSEKNIACGVAMMNGFLGDTSKTFLFTKGSYWHHLRSNTQFIKKYLDQNPVCGN